MGLKERLATANRTLPTVQHWLRVDDDTLARVELAKARAEGDTDWIATAQTALDGCYEELTLTALAPEVMETLREQHPPSEQHREQGALFNRATFVPALIAASCVGSDVTVEEWAEYTTKGPLTPGEVNELFAKIWDLNYRGPDPWVGKGSTSTTS